MACFGLGFHVRDIDDPAVIGQKCNRQRDQRVPHPEALGRRLLKNEKHPFIWTQPFPKHQTASTTVDIACDLGPDQIHARLKRRSREPTLLRLSLRWGRAEESGREANRCQTTQC